MKRILTLATLVAFGAGMTHGQTTAAAPAKAKAAYCQDPTTHKRISCKATQATAKPAATPAAAPTAAPAKKPSMMSAFMKPKPVTSTPAPMSSPAPAATPGGAPRCTTGKACGHSCIAKDKVCHKAT